MTFKINIESVNTKDISILELKKIAELEKDMWARGIGEYVECNGCGKISSKKDIFGYLPIEILFNTVSKIEKLLNIDKIKCPNCNGDTRFIYDEEKYIENIWERYFKKESFLTVYKDSKGIIRGFIDGYLDNLENIYEKEFKDHFSDIGLLGIKNRIEEIKKSKIPDILFMFSSLGTEEGYKDHFITFSILKNFFNSINKDYSKYLGIAETIIGSTTNQIFSIMGAIHLGLNTGNKINTDIIIQNNVVSYYKESFNLSVNEFITIKQDIMLEK